VQTTDKVVYLVPKDAGLLVKGDVYAYSYRGISFRGPSKSTFTPVGRGYDERNATITRFHFQPTRNLLEATRENTHQIGANAKWLAFTKYYVDFTVEEKPEGFVMTLVPKEVELRRDRSLTVNLAPPAFPEEELLDLLSKGSVEVVFATLKLSQFLHFDTRKLSHPGFSPRMVQRGRDVFFAWGEERDARHGGRGIHP
jgi:hypothetical protein